MSLSCEPEFMSWQKVSGISSSHQSIWEAKSHLEIGLSLYYPKHLLETGVGRAYSLCRQSLLSESDLSRKDISWKGVSGLQNYVQAGEGAASGQLRWTKGIKQTISSLHRHYRCHGSVQIVPFFPFYHLFQNPNHKAFH